MANQVQPIQTLIQMLSKLPGIGSRSAERIAFYMLQESQEKILGLADAIRDVKLNIRHCSICYNLTDVDPCPICTNDARDQGLVCVVEQPKDLITMEGAGTYHGVYHVLMGHISPQRGIEPGELTIEPLMKRLESGKVREVIMGLNLTQDGDLTAMYIQNLVQQRSPQVALTRLARGLPTGSNIEFANKSMISDAIAGRQKM